MGKETELTYEPYANPFLVCVTCSTRAVGKLERSLTNWPCGHDAEVLSICPTWNAVDGCVCLDTLGAVVHDIPVEGIRDRRKPKKDPPPIDPPPVDPPPVDPPPKEDPPQIPPTQPPSDTPPPPPPDPEPKDPKDPKDPDPKPKG